MKLTKQSLSKNNGTLDRLWRTVGKETAVCEICATLPPNKRKNYTKLDPHHIIGRTNKLTRWDLDNRLWVCSSHHTLGMWSETVQDNSGGWFLNWESDNDWMGQHRKESKDHLKKLRTVPYKQWTLDELIEIYKKLKRYENAL